jgi:dTDP-glucose 4,6-dehydratase
MPKVFQCLREGKKIPVYGDGKNIRDWFYVKDCAKFIEKIVSSNPVNETYNITNEHEIQNIEVIKQACKIAGKEFEDSISFVPDRLGHDFRYSISSSKFKTKFKDFESRTDFNQALTDTMNFYNLE